MKENWVSPSQEEKLFAALAHGSILIPTWGLIIAAVVWITQRGRSRFVEQQARQATAWQMAQLLLSVGIGALTFFMAVLIMLLGAASGTLEGEPPLVFFCIFPLVGVLMLGLFSFFGIGVWGAIRSLQGRGFVYPVIGARVERYLAARG